MDLWFSLSHNENFLANVLYGIDLTLNGYNSNIRREK